MTDDKKEVKFLDIKAQLPLIQGQIIERFKEIIENTAFVSGKNVKSFEIDFANYIGTNHCIAVSNGTAALQLALWAKGIGRGDEVIMPVNTFIATAEAVTAVGAKPVFVDMNEEVYTIDVNKIEQNINKNTKAIIPVHLYGQCADMDKILALAQKYNLFVVEDACQAHGAEYRGKKAGSLGEASAFSFYPGKNLGAWGEGGAICTNDEVLAEKTRMLRDHGLKTKYIHELVGGNYRMSEFQGSVLSVKLKFLDVWNEQRRHKAKIYLERLAGKKNLILPVIGADNLPVWHLFVVRAIDREEFVNFLKEKGIQTGIHYPFPLHLTAAYQNLGYQKGDFPVAEKVQGEIFSLPMFAELREEDIEYVVEQINIFLSKYAS